MILKGMNYLYGQVDFHLRLGFRELQSTVIYHYYFISFFHFHLSHMYSNLGSYNICVSAGNIQEYVAYKCQPVEVQRKIKPVCIISIENKCTFKWYQIGQL